MIRTWNRINPSSKKTDNREVQITIELGGKSWRFRYRSFPYFARIYRSSDGTSIVCKNLVLLKVSRIFREWKAEKCQDLSPFPTTYESRICTGVYEYWSERLNVRYAISCSISNRFTKTSSVSWKIIPESYRVRVVVVFQTIVKE